MRPRLERSDYRLNSWHTQVVRLSSQTNRGGSNEYKRGFNDGRNSRECDTYKHSQDNKHGYRDGELVRWKN